MKEPRGYEYTTDLLVVGCGFSGMWAAMRAKDFLDDVLVVDKGPRDWGGLGGLSGGDMIVKQPDMNLDDLLDDLVYYYDGLADQKLLGQILTQSYDRFMDFENWGHKFVRNDKGELCFIPQRALDYMRFYYYHPYGMGGIDKARLLKRECEKRGVRRLGRVVITDVITDGERVTGAVGFHAQSGAPCATSSSGRSGTCRWILPGRDRPVCCPRGPASSTTRAKTSCSSIPPSSAPRPTRITIRAA